MFQEKNEAIGIALKHSNILRTSPYAIGKHLAMRQYAFTCKCAVRNLKDQCELLSEEVEKKVNLQNSKNETEKIHHNRIILYK